MIIRTVALAAFLAASLLPTLALAQQQSKKSGGSCPGGLSACIERCTKAGGQPRLCPRYCEKQKGC